jgi:hypothetical protein
MLPVSAQELRERREDHDRPRRLRRLQRYAPAAAVELAADVNHLLLQMDVGPGEAEGLALAKTGEDRERKQRPPLLARRVEQASDPLAAEDRDLRAL